MQECLFIISSDKEHPDCPSTGGWKKNCGICIHWDTGILRKNEKEKTTDTQSVLDTILIF